MKRAKCAEEESALINGSSATAAQVTTEDMPITEEQISHDKKRRRSEL